MPTEAYAHGGLCLVVPHLSLERLYRLECGVGRSVNLLMDATKMPP